MEAGQNQSVEVFAPGGSEEKKQKWAEQHAHLLQQVFEQWQKPLGIDGVKYRNHLKEELVNYCDNPLLKSFIESIT